MTNQHLVDEFKDLAGRLADPPATSFDAILNRSRRRRRVRAAVATASVVAFAAVALVGVAQLRQSELIAPVLLSSPWEEEWLDVESVNAAMVDCLDRRGWDAQVEGNGVLIDHPDSQAAAASDALDGCAQELVEAGVVPDPSEPLPEELVRQLYDERVAFHACLKDNGFPVGEIQPWETFRQERETVSVDERWNPLTQVYEAGGVDAVARAHQTCGETE